MCYPLAGEDRLPKSFRTFPKDLLTGDFARARTHSRILLSEEAVQRLQPGPFLAHTDASQWLPKAYRVVSPPGSSGATPALCAAPLTWTAVLCSRFHGRRSRRSSVFPLSPVDRRYTLFLVSWATGRSFSDDISFVFLWGGLSGYLVGFVCALSLVSEVV